MPVQMVARLEARIALSD